MCVNFCQTTVVNDSYNSAERVLMEISKHLKHYIEGCMTSGLYTSSAIPKNPVEYELMCAEILRTLDWDIHMTPSTGDHGIDVIARKNQQSLAIQCKQYSSPVGNSAVQEVVAGRNHYGLSQSVVVTEAGYTRGARQLAATNNVLLLNSNDLEEIDSILDNLHY